MDISEALEDAGYAVIAVANADEAMKVLESRNNIRTIFTDITAGFNGRTETGRSRERSLAANPHHRHDWHEGAPPRRDSREQCVYCQAVSQGRSLRGCALVRVNTLP